MLAESFLRSGKVRDLYALGDDRLLLVASDRICAFDVVLPTIIPDKGRVLTGLSRFWFAETGAIVPNHLLGTDPAVLPRTIGTELRRGGYEPPDFGPLDAMRGRIMICRPARVLPIEVVVRGYLAGSGWKDYREHGAVCGIPLPPGLRESDRLPEPIFTPATKAEQGEHDENISFDGMIEHIGGLVAGHAGNRRRWPRRSATARIGSTATARPWPRRRGILLADTKFEFGDRRAAGPADPGPREEWLGPPDTRPSGERMLGPLDGLPDPHRRGPDPRFVALLGRRDLRARPRAGELRQAVRPRLARDAAVGQDGARARSCRPTSSTGTRARYVEAFERITGASFERYLEEDVIAR